MNSETKNKYRSLDVTTSANDKRGYRYLVLDNEMKILLISDETTERAAASVDVHVGQTADPDEVPGIAHFCEHMLFLGTSKYPVENDFMQFLSQNGGRANGCTSLEHTNYHFEVKAEQLKSALDRFSYFFIEPLFDQDSTDRELNAIDSEHQKNVLNDSRRMYRIDQETSKTGHAYSKFGTGNLETLKSVPRGKNIDIRELLLQFHGKFYSSNIMTLAVLGKESLDELEVMAVSMFQNVVNKHVVIPEYLDHPYGEEQLKMFINVVTIKECKIIKLIFPTPDLVKHYKEKPAHCISHLIGHEGEGSLLSFLKKKAWINELCSGEGGGGKGYSFFKIQLSATDEGMENINEIIKTVFQYVNLLKKEEFQEWIFQEMKMLDEIMFRFKDKEMPLSYVTKLSQNMQVYPATDTLYGPYMLVNFRPDLINSVLDCLTPRQFRYVVASQSFKGSTDLVSKYYDAEYSIGKIPEEQLKEWEDCGLNSDLSLPKKNIFIPESLDLRVTAEEDESGPKIVKDNDKLRVWYKADNVFLLPKACIDIHITSPYANITPLEDNLLSVFIALVKDELNEYGYAAELADLQYMVLHSTNGIIVKIQGYDNKQLLLLKKILTHIVTLEVKNDRFDVTKEKIERSLRNYELNQPYTQISSCNIQLTEQSSWDTDDLLSSMDGVTVGSLEEFVPRLLKCIYVEMLLCGNLDTNCVDSITGVVESMLLHDATPLLPLQHVMPRSYQLPPGSNYLFEKRNKVHSMSCVHVYMQVGLQATKINVICELFAQILHEPFFDQLRTKDQLGYIVFGGICRLSSTQGIRLLIQSDKPPSVVSQKIDSFLESFHETLTSMPADKFSDYVQALSMKKLEKPKRLRQQAAMYGAEILSKQYNFERAEIEVEALKKITKDEIVSFYKEYVSPQSTVSQKITVVILGKDAESLLKASENKNYTYIDDVLKYKSCLGLYPLVLPYNNEIPLLAPSTKSKL